MWIQRLKGYPDTTEEILLQALLGEKRYGIALSHQMVAGDLDEESTRLIDELLEEDQKRAEQLKRWFEAEKGTLVKK